MSKAEAQKAHETHVSYRALEDCRVGGLFRRKGEIVLLAKKETPLPFLELITEVTASSACSQKTPKTSENHVTKEDLGMGRPTPSSALTSSDMVKK